MSFAKADLFVIFLGEPGTMDSPTRRFLEFGTFRIDTEDRRLLSKNRHIPLAPKLCDLLILLVENNGHTLSKDELMDRIWADAVVEENSLTRSISVLRKTLADDSPNAPYIRTVPKRGYRFEADVHVVLEDEEELLVEKRTNYSVTLHHRQSDGSRETRLLPTQFVSRPYLAGLGITIVAGLMILLGIAWTIRVGGDAGLGERSGAAGSDDSRVDPQAFELYTRGRSLWRTRAAADLHQATLLLEQAVEKDPGFARAHAALADAYAFDVAKWRKVEAVAGRAIELDPTLGEPYASIGFVKLFWEWSPAEADAYFKRAVVLAPDYATGHQWYAISFAANRQFNQGVAEMERALQLEPDSVAINADMCQMLYFVGRYDEAERQCSRTLELDPGSFNAHGSLFAIYSAKEMYSEAVAQFFKREEAAVNHSSLPADRKTLKAAFDTGGIHSFWRTHIAMMERTPPDPGYALAQCYARLGDRDRALHHLQRAYKNRDFGFILLGADPAFASLRADPRFTELRSRLTWSD